MKKLLAGLILFFTCSVAFAQAPSVTITRPANTTAYSAGDVVGAAAAALTFSGAGQPQGEIIITDADLLIKLAAVPASMTTFRLHLYDVTPPSAFADGDAWTLPAGDNASYLGYVDLGTPIDVGATLFVQTSNINKKLRISSPNLFGYLVTNGGYTPTSGEVLVVRLNGIGL